MNRVEVMKACLAEAGYPELRVEPCSTKHHDDCEWPHVWHGLVDETCERAIHRAFLVIGCPDASPCFLCWDHREHECEHRLVPTTP